MDGLLPLRNYVISALIYMKIIFSSHKCRDARFIVFTLTQIGWSHNIYIIGSLTVSGGMLLAAARKSLFVANYLRRNKVKCVRCKYQWFPKGRQIFVFWGTVGKTKSD